MPEYFKNLLSLLKIEREEDLRLYQKLTETTSIADRRAAGITWYPIAIRNTEMSRGDYLTVEAERTTHQDLTHQIRFGNPAVLFSNHDPKVDRVEGTIAFQGGNRLKITLRTEELPEWANNGKLGIELLFDSNSYQEMEEALKEADRRSEDEKNYRLIKVLLGEEKATFRLDTSPYIAPKLNPSQQESLNNILAANELAIIHGPPGTGKTTTLIQAIKALIKQDGKQILVVAPSNTAVDLLTEKLAEEGLNVIRVGNPARVSEELMSLTLDSKTAGHSLMKDVKGLKKQANEYRNMAHKYKRQFGRAEREQRKALFDEAHKIMKEVGNIEQFIQEDLLAKAQVITATLVGSNHYTVRNLKYQTVVIDEAGQALEPACWIPILKASKLILAGDHLQLPPTIKSEEAGKKGLSTTLLEKAVQVNPEAVVLLEEQYRMNKIIMGYSSKVFYENRLKANPSVAEHLIFPADRPLTFIDTAGCGFEEKLEGTSTVNPDEAAFLIKHLAGYANEVSQENKALPFPTVALISPYKEQIVLLKELMNACDELLPYQNRMSVNTIDSFQGQERDVVYISLTRSNNEGTIGFLADIRRMNVAMTRAKKKLVVIGDSATLSRSAFYAGFIAYAEECEGYKSAWEYL